MAFLRNFPLLVLPLILYNLLSFGLMRVAGPIWQGPALSLPMISGADFILSRGDLLILFALGLLFFEILKATRTARATIVDHLLSTLVFVAYLIQFIVDPRAATFPFFTCLMIAFLDVVAGYSISIRVASRDVTLDRGL
ncbi:MAG: hypothetical protein H2045_06895 [Rhizobiales bacterium]|nr:hypothetical protein [Hyphomicrobiales bacterium]